MNPNTPVLIGAGQGLWSKGDAPGPRAMLAAVARKAAADAGLSMGALAQCDLAAVVEFTVDARGVAQRIPFPRMANPPAALAEDLGAANARALYTRTGGNTPQALVNHVCEEIAEGRVRLAVLAGAEFLGSLMKRMQAGQDLAAFAGGPDTTPPRWGVDRPDCTPEEAAHGLNFPANTYPLFENAIRAHRGLSLETHQHNMGALFAPFSAVAAQNPYAWFPTERNAAEIATETPNNRMVGFPYTKYLNAVIQVDQAAALILCSTAMADELGVALEKRVYLHGCSDTTELWNPLDRVDYHSSPAIRIAAREAFAMAGKTPRDMEYFDIYSCFPSAVEIACAEIGVAEDDARGLTVTGGLPYFGGPGNNYAMHSIAEMMMRLREKPGAFGLVTANGWYLTKHAMGVYSTTPIEGGWRRKDPHTYQAEIDALKGPEIVKEPNGPATIETYTVVHARDHMRMGIVIGRDAAGRRFVANTPDDEASLRELKTREAVGRRGRVTSTPGGLKNIFVLDE